MFIAQHESFSDAGHFDFNLAEQRVGLQHADHVSKLVGDLQPGDHFRFGLRIGEIVGYDVLCTIHLFKRKPQIPGILLVVLMALQQQLQETAGHRQRIAHLMRNTRGKLADHLKPLNLHHLIAHKHIFCASPR